MTIEQIIEKVKSKDIKQKYLQFFHQDPNMSRATKPDRIFFYAKQYAQNEYMELQTENLDRALIFNEISIFIEHLEEKTPHKINLEQLSNYANIPNFIKSDLIKIYNENYNPKILFCKIDIQKEAGDLRAIKQFIDIMCPSKTFLYEINFDHEKSIFFQNKSLLKSLKNNKSDNLNDIIKENKFTISQIFNLIYYLPQLKTEIKDLHNKPEKFVLQNNESLTKDFDKLNIFQKEIIDTLKNNYGNNKIQRVVQLNGKFIESQFTDFQAYHICKGIKNKTHLFDRYSNNTNNKQDDFDAHDVAMRTLQKNGKPIIDFILSLPSTPFKCENFKLLFSSLDRQLNNENPIVRLKLKNIKGKTEEIEYCFIVENGTKYKNQVRIRNKTTNTNLFEVSRDGFVICEENIGIQGVNRNITPIIQLFYRVTENEEKLKNEILTYGIESGKCSICGRELTNQISKIKGIGPVCENYL